MDAKGNKQWFDDPNARWTRMGELVELFGTEDDKLAWMLCRGDAAEWRIDADKYNDPLEGFDSEHQRAEQLGKNCEWLIQMIDIAHSCLCPTKNGTWQERVKQVVEAAKKIASAAAEQKAHL